MVTKGIVDARGKSDRVRSEDCSGLHRDQGELRRGGVGVGDCARSSCRLGTRADGRPWLSGLLRSSLAPLAPASSLRKWLTIEPQHVARCWTVVDMPNRARREAVTARVSHLHRETVCAWLPVETTTCTIHVFHDGRGQRA